MVVNLVLAQEERIHKTIGLLSVHSKPSKKHFLPSLSDTLEISVLEEGTDLSTHR